MALRSTGKITQTYAAPRKGMKVYAAIVGAMAFGAFYLAVICSVGHVLPRALAVITGIISCAAILAAGKKFVKWIVLGSAAVYSVLCIAVNFGAFCNGLMCLWDDIAAAANGTMHWGLPSAHVAFNAGGAFSFCSVLSVWLGAGVAALIKFKSPAYIFVSAAVLIALTVFGLRPNGFLLALVAFSYIGLFAGERALDLKSSLCTLAAVALVFAVVAPAFTYGGSDGVKNFRDNVYNGVEELTYGKVTLPEGNLEKSPNMRASKDTYLQVTLTGSTPNLYLKGFVGSTLDGNRWLATDKNVYVSNDYQGLIGYIERGGLLVYQFSEYLRLCGTAGDYPVTVKNVAASSKYVYVPYAVNGCTAGSSYYDLGLRGSVFTPKTYSYVVADGDISRERTVQAGWLLNGTGTPAAVEYMTYEAEYRAFVHDTYATVDDGLSEKIRAVLPDVQVNSINTATQIIRTVFLGNYVYSDDADRIRSDFMTEFLGGQIVNANAAYFATAATCMFRYYGFAARYAEGYFVRSDGASSEYTVDVTGRYSHAWTEVYFDGIGWLPIEVTPRFFTEDEYGEDIAPDNPNKQPDPILPDEEPEEPPEQKPENPDYVPPYKNDGEKGAYIALVILIPVTSVLLAAAAAAAGIIVRRQLVIDGKRKKLRLQGDAFGRAAYNILEKDMRAYGGLSAEALAKYGVGEESFARFTELIEKSVYGGVDLSFNERLVVTAFMRDIEKSVTEADGKLRALIRKYLKCLGI